MKLVIFGVVAFVLGIAGSSGVLVMTSPKLPAGADSLLAARADSLHHLKPVVQAEAGAHPATGHSPAPTAHADSAVTPPEHAVEAAVASTHPTVEHVVPPAPVAAVGPEGPTPTEQADAYKQVGSILNNMKPAEAARILAYLSDSQVEGLLRSMGPRPSAAMLGQLPPERAAALSKRLLVPAPKGAQH